MRVVPERDTKPDCEPGIGTDWVSWRSVSLKLAEVTRVCVYDRAGYGWSDPGPRPRTAGRIATELHALLTNAEVGGPYILVAHSFAGYVARIYANRFPQSVSAVVLVDPSSEDENGAPAAPVAARIDGGAVLALVPPLGWQRLKRLYQGDGALPANMRDLPAAYRNRALVGSSLEQLKSEDKRERSASRTELNKRFSFPFSCVAFAIIGVPLGVTAHRRETSIGFAMGLIVATTYFLFVIIGDTLRGNPHVHPELLVWFPNVLFIILGCLLFRRLARQ